MADRVNLSYKSNYQNVKIFVHLKKRKQSVKRVWALRVMKCQLIGNIVQGVI